MKSVIAYYIVLISLIFFISIPAFAAHKWTPLTNAEQEAFKKVGDILAAKARINVMEKALPGLIENEMMNKEERVAARKMMTLIRKKGTLFLDMTPQQIRIFAANRNNAIKQLNNFRRWSLRQTMYARTMITNATTLIKTLKIAQISKGGRIVPGISNFFDAHGIAQSVFHSKEVLQEKIDELTNQININDVGITEIKKDIVAVTVLRDAIHMETRNDLTDEELNLYKNYQDALDAFNKNLNELEKINILLKIQRDKLELIVRPMA